MLIEIVHDSVEDELSAWIRERDGDSDFFEVDRPARAVSVVRATECDGAEESGDDNGSPVTN
jgi:hypothetical protein